MKKPKDYYIYKVSNPEYKYIDNNEEKIQENLRKYYSFLKMERLNYQIVENC